MFYKLICIAVTCLLTIGILAHRVLLLTATENASAQLVNVMALIFSVVVLIGCLTSDFPLPAKPKKAFGSPDYDMKVMLAPRIDGIWLRIASFVFSHNLIGHIIRKPLKNINGVGEMRDLAEQAGTRQFPIVYYPICRQFEPVTDAMAKTATDVLTNGNIPISYDNHRVVGIMDYYNAYKGDKVTPSQMMFRVFEAIDQLKILNLFSDNFFVEFNRTSVMDQARESDKRWEAKKPLSVFDGVPVAIKDAINVKGFFKRDGMARHKSDEVAEVDDLMVQRLREAGAIILATTVMTEFGRCPLGYNSHYKGPFNPYNEECYTGGSSSGSVVSVMTGLVPVAVSFDSGGSIRLPAALCGGFGLSPTFGRIPHDADDLIASPNIHAGVITANATDHALAYSLLAQVPPDHFYTSMIGSDGPPRPHLTDFDKIEDWTGLRIGIFWDYFNDADPEVVAKCKDVLKQLENRGAKIVEVMIPHLDSISLAHEFSVSMELSNLQERDFSSRNDLEPATRIQLAFGNDMSAMELLASGRLRGWAMDYCKQLFQKEIDVFVTPMVPVTAPPIPKGALGCGECNAPLMAVIMRYCCLNNFTGMPGMAMPVGYSDQNGLPISIQFMANHWQDALLLRLSHFVEKKVLQRQNPKHFVKVCLEA